MSGVKDGRTWAEKANAMLMTVTAQLTDRAQTIPYPTDDQPNCHLPQIEGHGNIPLFCPVPRPLHPTDVTLKARLEACAAGNDEYWSFQNGANRELLHGYFQYPAMMVPQVLRRLVGTLKENDRSIQWAYDPFNGSGTAMGEAMMAGLNFFGQDINPLAILVSRAKTGPFRVAELEASRIRVQQRIEADNSSSIDVSFNNREKWFFEHISIQLSKIRRAIRAEGELWIRRFLWVALAETVRLTSNSRTSTYKLHIRSREDLERRRNTIDALAIFNRISATNFGRFQLQRDAMAAANLLCGDDNRVNLSIRYGNSLAPLPNIGVPNGGQYNILLTSPPYGDNKTTIPYGQAAYLPLQWIPLGDIDESVNQECLKATCSIDSQSLGGSLGNAVKDSQKLCDISPTFRSILDELKKNPKTHFANRVAAFCRDLERSVSPILAALSPGAPMIWIVGNRSVGGQLVRMDDILAELLTFYGATEIVTLNRSIHSKRMPNKNSVAPTMGKETILIWRKSRN